MKYVLRSLPKFSPPAELTTKLLVLASREAQRRRHLTSAHAFFEFLRGELHLIWHNMMRPHAVPMAGGLISTVVLFALLAPALTVNRFPRTDVPTGLSRPAALEYALSFDLVETVDLVIDVTIDGQGKVVGYTIPRGQSWAKNPVLVRSVENTLLYTRFSPATVFGEPVSGRTRITLRHSRLDVRG